MGPGFIMNLPYSRQTGKNKQLNTSYKVQLIILYII